MKLSDGIKTMYNGYLGVSQTVKAFLTVTCTYLMMLIFFLSIRAFISMKSHELMSAYNNSNDIIGKNISTTKISGLGNDNYSKILKIQGEVVNLRRQHHYDVAMTFFKNYYSVTVCLMIISCIGGLILFVLINRGWAGSSYTLKVLFLAMASTAIFLSLFTGVFSQQKNFEQNMLRYMDYTKTELDFSQKISELSKADYPTLKKPLPVGTDSIWVIDTLKYHRALDTIVARNNSVINKMTDYLFSIDADKMRSMTQVYKELLDLKNMGKTDSSKIK